ncbi:MAG: helix-turn-helix domain-containing protein, partial [Hamadaea sp.]|nr:helix-turn-helix domain-containing protein [Hamadaea sp.]
MSTGSFKRQNDRAGLPTRLEEDGAMAENGGSRVREHRIQTGLTQEELARIAGLSVRALRDIEQGRVTRPHPGSLRRLAVALGQPSEAFVTSGEGLPTVGVLGPLMVLRRGVVVTVRAPMQQMLLTLLGLEHDRHVGDDEIADVLWSGRPPTAWRNRVQALIGQTRQ